MKPSYLFLAPGFEEIEALATVDVLRRCGMDVYTVSISNNYQVTGAKNVTVVADKLIADVDLQDADWLICPGGMPGATNLSRCEVLTSALISHFRAGGHVAAICASPAVVLAPLGIIDGKRATCYPGMGNGIKRVVMTGRDVEIADNVITANGPASTLMFALAIARVSVGVEKAREVADGLLYTHQQPPIF